MWEISWGNTPRGQTDKQRCPLGPGVLMIVYFVEDINSIIMSA